MTANILCCGKSQYGQCVTVYVNNTDDAITPCIILWEERRGGQLIVS